MRAIYQQPCIPNTPPKRKVKKQEKLVLPTEDVEDGLDAEIDKFSEKQDTNLRKPPGNLRKGPTKPLVTFGKTTPGEANRKRTYMKDTFERGKVRNRSGQSDRSRLGKVRFADDISRSSEIKVEEIIDAADGPQRYIEDSEENSREDQFPLVIPPRHMPYKEMSFKGMKYQKRKRNIIDEEQELFGATMESNDDQASHSQLSQFSQLRSDVHSWRSPTLKKARPSSAQVKVPASQVYGINANKF